MDGAGRPIKGERGMQTDFRVPLSGPALEIAREAAQYSENFLFPGHMGRKGVTGTALQKALNQIGESGRPHGFRTSVRTWVQDTEAASFDVAETALAHKVGSKVERSYARSDLLETRRGLMDKRACFVTGDSAALVALRR